ncbi:hypothetical protein H6P81_017077 [Aristolochia fimbriata]|uniref:Disease resistance R13L4/SHOC-2-like LRR domain-containing protein n=1 Tax=Aristolochia fimbriata TaxID=158543 RepID=A0AAV7DY72_ARIFI|nr:hypothetical protein H6P81_017077 [Aristolochia fimbriata]
MFGFSWHRDYQYLEELNQLPCSLLSGVPGDLSHLHTLDLGSNYDLRVDHDFAWVSSLSSLHYLDLSWLNLSTAENWVQQINQLSVLRELHLTNCMLPKIHSPIFRPFANLTATLNVLDLSYNYHLLAEPNSWLTNFSSLTHLYLISTGLDGSMPPSIGNLTNLEVLDLSENSINGTIPRSLISNLCHLRILRLGGNSIRGMEPLPRCLSDSLEELNLHGNQLGGDLQVLLGEIRNSKTLKKLYLSYNSLSGFLPGIGNLTNLEVLDLSKNSINGTVPRCLISNLCHLRILRLGENSIRGMEPFPRCLSDSLEELDLSYNQLSGHVILQNIGKLSNLARLSISDNSLPIVITEDVLSNLQWLEDIDLSNNRLVWKVKSRTWLPPYISRIYLSSSQVGPKFPSWLQHHNAISELNMSNAKISDDVPNWFWKIATNMGFLDLSDNQLRGYLPNNIGMSAVYKLDISNNSLSGPIPEDLCMLKNLQKLDLSSNHFHGNIPDCWGKGGRNLYFIDLSNNNLLGDFPRSLGDLPCLAFLHMRNNFLSGEISTKTKNMNNLVVLDLAYNRLSGVLPTWGTIGEQLLNLRILSLRSNLIHGDIPSQISQLSSLQFLDLSYNKLSGAIPTSFGNFTAMTMVHSEIDGMFMFKPSVASVFFYQTEDYVWMNLKGVELENSRNLGFMKHIDLSSNNLSGDIPEELTHLLGLHSLNLSSNSLKEGIPNKIGELKKLESLDLSKNKLSGEIPSSISNLNFLSKLNLSYNNLSGPIPTGFQLQTLNVDSSVYVGNDNLCGPPLLRKCSTNELPNNRKLGGAEKRGKEDEFEIIGLFISIALGFVVGFWGFYGFLIFKRSWRIWYYRFVDEMMDKVYVAFVVRVARLKRKFKKSTEI